MQSPRRGFAAAAFGGRRDPKEPPSVGAQVPPLTFLALEAVVRNFEKYPSLAGISPQFVSAIAARLPTTLDVAVTAPAMHDEVYWKRVCCDQFHWEKIELADYGGSWKKAFLSLYVSSALELFGIPDNVPHNYEEEHCRPPIDGTHARWPVLYPKEQAVRPDGKPNKERFSSNAVANTGSDQEIMVSADSGWPRFEFLKSIGESMPGWRGVRARGRTAAESS